MFGTIKDGPVTMGGVILQADGHRKIIYVGYSLYEAKRRYREEMDLQHTKIDWLDLRNS